MKSQQLPAIPMQVCPRPLSHQGNPTERQLTAACMTNITLKCNLIGFKQWQHFWVKPEKCDNQWLLVNQWLTFHPKSQKKSFCDQVQNDEVFLSLLFQVLSPLWYIFDHSQIPCGELDTHFPGVKPSSPVTVINHSLYDWVCTIMSVCMLVCVWRWATFPTEPGRQAKAKMGDCRRQSDRQ